MTIRRTIPTAISGGESGAKLIDQALKRLEADSEPRRNAKNERPDVWLEQKRDNLVLLDSPVMREDFQCVPHNHLAHEVLDFLQSHGTKLPIRIEALTRKDQHLNEKESLKIAAKTGEEGSYVADAVSDYGIVARFPNPFNYSSRVVLLAGLHAPATHAAAFAVTHVSGAAHLLKYLGENNVNAESFVAAFRVERSYLADRLTAPEWLQAEEIVVHNAANSEPTKGETHNSRTALMNNYTFNGPVTGSVFGEGGKVVINDPAVIATVISEVLRHRNDIALSPEQDAALEKAVATLREGDRGQPSVAREALASIRHVLEHAAGAMVGHAGSEWLPTVLHQLDILLKLPR